MEEAMRHLTLLFTLLLASVALAATAKALPAPLPAAPLAQPVLSTATDDEGEGGEEAEEADEGEEAEACEPEEEEEEAGGCEEEAEEEEECVLESADASVVANPASGKVRIAVRYAAFFPAAFALDYSLRGGKGGLHLGSARARFHRAGAFHDVVTVAGRKLAKLAAARQFVVEIRAVGTPGYCREELTEAAPHRASWRHRAGA
jgi:hypothetical protein